MRGDDGRGRMLYFKNGWVDRVILLDASMLLDGDGGVESDTQITMSCNLEWRGNQTHKQVPSKA